MDNYTFSISFLEDRSFSKITISGDMRKLLEFQTKENVFPEELFFADEDILSGIFSRENSKKLVHWLQKNGAKYTQKV